MIEPALEGDRYRVKKREESSAGEAHGSPKIVVGRSEYVDFPEWHVLGLQAKVDTGARTSALHVEDIVALEDGRVRFHVVMSRKYRHRRKEVEAKVVKWARVRSSTGHYTMRCFVKAHVRIGPVEKEIELSLVCREKMLYRMLLGREALERDFLVDVTKRNAISAKPKPKRRTGKPCS